MVRHIFSFGLFTSLCFVVPNTAESSPEFDLSPLSFILGYGPISLQLDLPNTVFSDPTPAPDLVDCFSADAEEETQPCPSQLPNLMPRISSDDDEEGMIVDPLGQNRDGIFIYRQQLLIAQNFVRQLLTSRSGRENPIDWDAFFAIRNNLGSIFREGNGATESQRAEAALILGFLFYISQGTYIIDGHGFASEFRDMVLNLRNILFLGDRLSGAEHNFMLDPGVLCAALHFEYPEASAALQDLPGARRWHAYSDANMYSALRGILRDHEGINPESISPERSWCLNEARIILARLFYLRQPGSRRTDVDTNQMEMIAFNSLLLPHAPTLLQRQYAVVLYLSLAVLTADSSEQCLSSFGRTGMGVRITPEWGRLLGEAISHSDVRSWLGCQARLLSIFLARVDGSEQRYGDELTRPDSVAEGWQREMAADFIQTGDAKIQADEEAIASDDRGDENEVKHPGACVPCHRDRTRCERSDLNSACNRCIRLQRQDTCEPRVQERRGRKKRFRESAMSQTSSDKKKKHKSDLEFF